MQKHTIPVILYSYGIFLKGGRMAGKSCVALKWQMVDSCNDNAPFLWVTFIRHLHFLTKLHKLQDEFLLVKVLLIATLI